MVGSLEADIQDVQNTIDNRDVIDDFDDDNDERTTYNFHKMEVCRFCCCCFYCCMQRFLFVQIGTIPSKCQTHFYMLSEREQ